MLEFDRGLLCGGGHLPHIFMHPQQVLKLEQQAADQAATQAAAMEKMAAKMFHAQAKMEQMMAQAEAKVS